MARDIVVQVRLTQREAAAVARRGERLAKRWSGLTKPDGAINMSATIRHVLLKGDPGA